MVDRGWWPTSDLSDVGIVVTVEFGNYTDVKDTAEKAINGRDKWIKGA